MGFFNFRNIYRLIAWSFGMQIQESNRNSTGFDSSAFLPEERYRSTIERAITVSCSCLTLVVLLQPACLKFEFLSGFYSWFAPRTEIIALPGLVWMVYMLIPNRRPMDRVAIEIGAFTLTPWLIPYVIGILFLSREDLLCLPFFAHFLGYVVLVIAGLILDVRVEMRAKAADRESYSETSKK
jgi:hypothetical protein